MKDTNSTNSIVCTLFEGNYHYGLAALINSLYKHGFEGKIYVGFRGKLPSWTRDVEENDLFEWPNSCVFVVENKLPVIFLPLDTNWHLTNYKPDFMLKILSLFGKDVKNVFYFDPDITIKCEWDFFERWVSFGIALVHEIVWQDMPHNHPKRYQWLTIAQSLNIQPNNKLSSYINAGFLGLNRDCMSFLELWRDLILHAHNSFGLDPILFNQNESNGSSLFTVADQDMLNLSAMCTNLPLSEFGPEGMDFLPGGWLMSHATGSPKPWNKNYFFLAINGIPPSQADKEFWKYINAPISPFKHRNLKFKKIMIRMSSLIGRFYQRR